MKYLMSFSTKCTYRDTWMIDDYDTFSFCRINHPDLGESGELQCSEDKAKRIVKLLNTKCKKQEDCEVKVHTEYGSRGSRFSYLTFTHLPSQENIETRLQHNNYGFNVKFNKMFDVIKNQPKKE